jgi:hypothetical protein
MQLLHEEDKTALQKAPSGLEILQGFWKQLKFCRFSA